MPEFSEPAPRARWTDFLWLLLFPIHFVLGTARHEASHALAGLAQGASIAEYSILPSGRGWGYVRLDRLPSGWLVPAAPYLCDVLTFGLGCFLCMRLPGRFRGLFINVLGLMVLSPLVNSANAYNGGLRGRGDVGYLLQILPPIAVNVSFVAALAVYLVGTWLLLTRSPVALQPRIGDTRGT